MVSKIKNQEEYVLRLVAIGVWYYALRAMFDV